MSPADSRESNPSHPTPSPSASHQLLEDDEDGVTGITTVSRKEAESLAADREAAIGQTSRKMRELRNRLSGSRHSSIDASRKK